MKVILLHDVPGLGQPGDVKDVANGYARNYLLPRQLVTAATASQLANLRDRVATAQRRVAKQREADQSLATRLSEVTLTFAVRVGQGERLYGSVTSQNIVDALQEQEGLAIDRRLIQLRDPLRQLGDFEVGVRIAQGLEPKIKVRVISSQAAASEGASEGESEGESEASTAEAPAEV
ncbi:MAG TPA: 50S ribosomal protein L9 [Ktedonobacterales bacterium]|nr:50S ribosomal protein L9 [Ktedonobacterales bacterium]